MQTTNQPNNKSSRRAGLFLTLALLFILVFSYTAHVYAANPANKNATGEAATGPAVSTGPETTPEPVATPTPVPTPTPTPPPPGRAKLRLMYTTDIHGQITGMDYQRQTSVVRGLDRVSTMMTRAREEMNNRNCMLFDVGDNFHAAVLQTLTDARAQFATDGGQVDAAKGHGAGAAQLKTARTQQRGGGQQAEGAAKHGGIPQMTRLTRRPGTTMTLRTVAPARKPCTDSAASAAASMSSRLASAATSNLPRSLPLT